MMFRNETITIKPLMNGYKVSYEYRVKKDGGKDIYARDFDYVDEEYMFSTWDEVVTFVTSTPLEVPPAKI